MTEMIRRVAESQAEFDGRSLIHMPRFERERYMARARAAIVAMRCDEAVEHVAQALVPKCAGFGGGGMPIAIAREFAGVAVKSLSEQV